MNRRMALTAFAGVAGGTALAGRAIGAERADPAIPGAVPFQFDKGVNINLQSTPTKVDGDDLHLISIGEGKLHLDKDSKLTATIKAAVVQYSNVEYRISAAVFDGQGRLLGTAHHTEQVQYIRTGYTPTIFRTITFDFGISKAFSRAAYVAVAISDRDVPKPG